MSSNNLTDIKITVGLILPSSLAYFVAAEEAEDPCRMDLDSKDLIARQIREDRDFCIPFTHPAFGMCFRCMKHGGGVEIIQEAKDADGVPKRSLKKYYYTHTILDIVATKEQPTPSTEVVEPEEAIDADNEA